MNFKNFVYQEKYNLFVSANDEAWESNTWILEKERCLTSFTSIDIKSKFGSFDKIAIDEIMKMPCLFMYEKGININPYIGYLTEIKVRDNGIKFTFKKIARISLDKINTLTFELDINMKSGITELMHTHWTIKKVNLYEELSENILLETNNSDLLKPAPTVFISYCWSPKKNKKRVEELVSRLKKDGVNVLYDQNCLRPGHDINLFMESLSSDIKVKKILIICNENYVKKADSREGGVGTESEIIIPQVYGKPMQNKIIPIFFEKDASGNYIVPTYLRSRYGIDLTPANEDIGYEKLIEDIFY